MLCIRQLIEGEQNDFNLSPDYCIPVYMHSSAHVKAVIILFVFNISS